MLKTKKFVILILTVGIISVTLVGFKAWVKDSSEEKEEITNLSWYFPAEKQPDQQVVEDELNKLLEERIGIHLSLNPIKSTDYDKKLNVMFAGKEEFDLCFTSNWANEYYSCVAKGMLLPLDDLIDTYAPKLHEAVPDFLFEVPQINGKIYAVPNYQVLYKQWSFVVRKDLIDKYKFDVDSIPKEAGFDTIMALESFLRIIKDNEPDMYPLRQAFSSDSIFYETIGGNSTVIKKGDTSRKVMANIDTPEWEKGMEILERWYNEGYLREDLFNVYSDTSVSAFLKYAVDIMVSKPGIEQELFSKYGKEYVVIPICSPFIESSAGMSTATGISVTSKNPEKAIELIELTNKDKEIYNMLCYGIEGKHYEKIDDKHIRIAPEKRYFPYVSWMFGNQFNAYLYEGQSDDNWEVTHKLNMESEKSPIYGFNFNPAPVIDKIVQIKAITKEYDYLYTGDKTYIKEYITNLKEAGIDDVVKETQKQIDEWAAKESDRRE